LQLNESITYVEEAGKTKKIEKRRKNEKNSS
jgi:hypothetical protein